MGYFFLISIFLAQFALAANPDCPSVIARLGAHYDAENQMLNIALYSENATRIETLLYKKAKFDREVHSFTLKQNEQNPHIWEGSISAGALKKFDLMSQANMGKLLDNPIFYGFRVWGPNWEYTPEWQPGTTHGFKSDVDMHGNRFNPNKLVYDPRALEISHDPVNPEWKDETVYFSGEEHRHRDSAPYAPKGIVLNDLSYLKAKKTFIERPLKDEIIYEAHLRGFTKNDPSIPLEERGTFKGAARKAKYLKELGITAIEFLPIQEFQNENNSEYSTTGNNYWGYMTNGYFAPERRYATKKAQETHGGVTQELKEMIDAFHAEGIKVYLDVVYNHTGEGGEWGEGGKNSKIWSMRGIDNSTYYQVAEDGRYHKDNSGCGANLNCAVNPVRDLIIDSLKHFRDLGVDGFRFDLAPILGNKVKRGNSFEYDKMPGENPLNRAVIELPARPYFGGYGVDLIAEPWAIGDGTYQLGNFPYHEELMAGWAEWNARFRDKLRESLNKYGQGHPSLNDLIDIMGGTPSIFDKWGRKPGHSINFADAHDGFTLKDIFSFDHKNNMQEAPYGPSDGGEDHNISWSQRVDGESPESTAARQRQSARTAFALMLFSQGTPMMVAGDEFHRTQQGNNNMWNVDSTGSWVDWSLLEKNSQTFRFSQNVIQLRKMHPSFRQAGFINPEKKTQDQKNNASYYRNDGQIADKEYLQSPNNHFVGTRLDAKAVGEPIQSIYLGVNKGAEPQTILLPTPAPGKRWYWAGDTSSQFEKAGNFPKPGEEISLQAFQKGNEDVYTLKDRALVLFIER